VRFPIECRRSANLVRDEQGMLLWCLSGAYDLFAIFGQFIDFGLQLGYSLVIAISKSRMPANPQFAQTLVHNGQLRSVLPREHFPPPTTAALNLTWITIARNFRSVTFGKHFCHLRPNRLLSFNPTWHCSSAQPGTQPRLMGKKCRPDRWFGNTPT